VHVYHPWGSVVAMLPAYECRHVTFAEVTATDLMPDLRMYATSFGVAHSPGTLRSVVRILSDLSAGMFLDVQQTDQCSSASSSMYGLWPHERLRKAVHVYQPMGQCYDCYTYAACLRVWLCYTAEVTVLL
jgi:hypothetical protein